MRTIANISLSIMAFFVMLAIFKTTTSPGREVVEVVAREDTVIVRELSRLEALMNRSLEDIRVNFDAMRTRGRVMAADSPTFRSPEVTFPTVYVITPTFKRYEQIPELTRLGQTLLNVPKIHWIVADDAREINPSVISLLKTLGIPYTYMLTPMPEKFHDPKYKAKPKGVANRNGGVDWLRLHATEGVFYFADDDNTYDIRLFEEIRFTKKVSMLPVGLTTHYGLSTPVLKSGKFVGWYDGWISNRHFPIDMAAFAVSVPFLLTRPEAKMPYTPGYEETGFLDSLNITMNEVEFVADNCTKIYVWHTKTQKNYASSRDILKKQWDDTNLRELQKVMVIKKKD
ncbi:galactosylgalactosylxylosylprotein 3-beta-glucuronosyltransferase P-like isoform X1 [Macrobrachium rosenbergii]|uniref:galactosylgalactosylxylosylprotein 3-beta-glucuronosyltransferase P-like isoform X1 n=2 Tax=Macrobrachium rosenbergii TaxID=79674 RepID=UPI0034D73DC4